MKNLKKICKYSQIRKCYKQDHVQKKFDIACKMCKSLNKSIGVFQLPKIKK